MKALKIALAVVLMFTVLAADAEKKEKRKGKVLKNTKTAVVEISLDETGMPVVNYDEIELKTGDRIIFVGPEDFEINFPKKSPFKVKKLMAQSGVINVKIKKRKNKKGKVNYKYDIIHNDKVLDPDLIIVHQ